MPKRERILGWIVPAALISGTVFAQNAPLVPKPRDAGADARAAASDAGHADASFHPGPVTGNEELPPGHPAMPPDDGDDSEEGAPQAADPHAANAANPHQGGAGMFGAPEDTVAEDASIPVGAIDVDLRDGDDKPLPHVDVTLGIIQQSVAKGENRKHVNQATNDQGTVRFSGLENGSGFAYRVSVPKDGASFAATPFQLPQTKGMKVKLHVYPVTTDPEQVLIASRTRLFVEVRDDRIQLEEVVDVFNGGKIAWVPKDLILALPPEFTALNAQQGMSDQGVDAIDKRGAKVHGTFGPGQSTIVFRWQLPYAGDSQVDFRIGMPPHVAAAEVMAAAAKEMKLHVENFPDAQNATDKEVGRLLVTGQEFRRASTPLREMNISLRDIPSPGPARFFATGLAALGVFLGIAYAYQARGTRRTVGGKGKDGEAKRTRQQLLAELEELERAHRAGDIGPKTYERTRRELVDAIARTLA